MRNTLNRILRIDRYESALQRNRAAMIYTLLAIMVGFTSGYALLVPQWGIALDQTLFQVIILERLVNEVVLLVALFYLFSGITFVLLRRGYSIAAGHMLLLTWFLGGVSLNLAAQPLLDSAQRA